MTTGSENLVLSILKNLQRDLSESRTESRSEFSEVKQRMGALEEQLANTRGDIASLRRDIAINAKMRAMLMSKVDEHSDRLRDLQPLH